MSFVPIPVLQILAVLFCLSLAGAAAGISLAEIPEASRWIVPFSGGLLLGIALFWVIPEVAATYGWLTSLTSMLGGFGVLWIVDRFVHPVCPACSPTHDHELCAKSLHGLAAPLLGAAAIHSFFDGWSVGVSQQQTSGGLRLAFLVGIGVHKIPEGLALGVLLLASTGSRWRAMLYCAGVQACMLLGGLAAPFVASHLAARWTGALLAAAAGVFVYLGYHAIEGQSRARGITRIMMPALTGAAGAAVLKLLPVW